MTFSKNNPKKSDLVKIAYSFLVIAAIFSIYSCQKQKENSQMDFYYQDWQTYRNDEYGFEVKYPSNFYVGGNGVNQFILLEKNSIGGYSDRLVEIRVDESLDRFDTYYNTPDNATVEHYGDTKLRNFIVGGYKAVGYGYNEKDKEKEVRENKAAMGRSASVGMVYFQRGLIINKNGTIIEISTPRYRDEFKKIFDQILSTFRFIESNELQAFDKQYSCQSDSDCTIKPIGCSDCNPMSACVNKNWILNCNLTRNQNCPPAPLWVNSCKCVNSKCADCRTLLESKKQCRVDGELHEYTDAKEPLCEEIAIPDSKDRCYYDYAMSRNNKELCNKIIDEVTNIECSNYFNNLGKIDTPAFSLLGSVPDAINIGKTVDVFFSVLITGSEEKPASVILEEIDISGKTVRILGDLNDDGKNGDLVGGDFFYGGTFRTSSNKEGFLYFKAKAVYSSLPNSIYTGVYKLGVTRFPVGISPSDMSKIVIDPETGEKMISNELTIGFREGTSPDRIEAIVTSIDGKIVSTFFGLKYFQVRISDTGDANGVKVAIIKVLAFPEVESAEPNYITEISS